MDARYIGRFGLELFRTKRSDVFPCGFSEQPNQATIELTAGRCDIQFSMISAFEPSAKRALAS